MGRSVIRKCIVILFVLAGLCSAAMAEKIIVFATAGSWPPAEYVNREGEVEGFAIDYIRAAGRAAGFSPVFESVAREDALAGLASGKYDAFIASSLRVRDDMEGVAVSRPFSRVRQVLLVRKGMRFNSEEAIRSARLGAMSASNGYALLDAMEVVNPVPYSDINKAVSDLIARKLDAFVCDYPIALYFSKSKGSSSLQITTFFGEPAPSFYAIAANKENREVVEVINEGIAAVKAKGIDRELALQWKWR